MAMLNIERRFLTAFAQAALGLEEGERDVAGRAVDRLEQFLDASPKGLRFTFHLALLVMPPGILTKLGFARRPLAWRRACLERVFRANVGRPPGWLIDRQAILATVKSMVSGSYCELPEFWSRIGYRARPADFRLRDGTAVVPPAGPEVEPTAPSEVGRFLHQRVTRLGDLPERFEGEKTIAIIGTGAAGLAAAHALLSRPEGRHLRIVLLEAGELRTNESFPRRTLDAFSQLYVNSGVTPGRSQRLGFIQGRVVGGGTTVNNAGSPRPEREWKAMMQWRWGSEGADLDWDALDQAFDDLRDPLHIREVDPRILTPGTVRVFQGFAGLEDQYTRAGLLQANLEDCVSCGQCNQGCPYDAHRAPFITLLPDLLRQSERVLIVPGATVTRLHFGQRGGRRGVTALDIRDAAGQSRQFRPDRVILAAGAYASSALLLRSGFLSSDNRRRLVGQRFSCNYASPVIGRFRERMDAGRGIQIGYIVEVPARRLIIETAFAPPTVLGMMSSHWGPEFRTRAEQFDHYGVAFPTLSSDVYGSIDFAPLTPWSSPQIRLELGDSDWARLGWGLALCADALRRAGAAELFDSRYDAAGVALTGDVVGDRARIAAYYEDFGPSTYVKVQSAHLQGGNVLHRDPTRGVVDNDLKVHGVDNLWILDSSVFPAPITLNIQYTTMALARYAALRLPLAQ
jgi:choline dehydrogenase-like flavoprotein